MEELFDILLVDDDEVDRMAVKRALRSAGMNARMVEATDAPEALEALKSQHFDCALLDFRLPAADGLAVLRDARRMGIATPIVMLTGQGGETLAVEIMKAGASDYIAKAALSPDRLAQSIRQAVRMAVAEQQALEARREVEAQRFRLQSLFTQAPVAIAMFEEPGHRFVLANPVYMKVMGPRTYLGGLIREVLPELADQGVYEILDHVYETGETHEVIEQRIRLTRSDGVVEFRYFNTTWQATRHASGLVYGVMAIGVEVTEQVLAHRRAQDAEERLRLAIDAGDIGIWDLEMTSGTLVWDSRCKAVFGLSPEDPVTYPIFLERLHPGDRKEVDQAIKHALSSTDGGDFNRNFRIVAADDEEPRWVFARGRVLFDERRLPVRFVGTVVDITAGKRAESERQRLYDAAQAAIASRDELLATVSHDLRSPLSVINMAAGLLQRQAEPETEVAKKAVAISRASKRMDHLIQDLLDLASIESGHLYVEVQAQDASSLIAEALEHGQLLAQAKGLRLESRSEVTDVSVLCDKNRIAQVFANIIGNAIKFTPSPGSVTLGAVRVDKFVRFSIRDTGPGIAPDELSRVFDRFWKSKETARAGTGLGLAICHGIIAHHHGQISVESTVGVGTTFSFTLPIVSPS